MSIHVFCISCTNIIYFLGYLLRLLVIKYVYFIKSIDFDITSNVWANERSSFQSHFIPYGIGPSTNSYLLLTLQSPEIRRLKILRGKTGAHRHSRPNSPNRRGPRRRQSERRRMNIRSP